MFLDHMCEAYWSLHAPECQAFGWSIVAYGKVCTGSDFKQIGLCMSVSQCQDAVLADSACGVYMMGNGNKCCCMLDGVGCDNMQTSVSGLDVYTYQVAVSPFCLDLSMRPRGVFLHSLHRGMAPYVWPGEGGRPSLHRGLPPRCPLRNLLWPGGLGFLGGRSGPHGGPAFVAPWCSPPDWEPRY